MGMHHNSNNTEHKSPPQKKSFLKFTCETLVVFLGKNARPNNNITNYYYQDITKLLPNIALIFYLLIISFFNHCVYFQLAQVLYLF